MSGNRRKDPGKSNLADTNRSGGIASAPLLLLHEHQLNKALNLLCSKPRARRL